MITGGLGRHLPRVLTGVVGSSVIGLSFLVSVAVFVHVLGQAPHARVDNIVYYRWAETGLFHLDVGFLIDPLTCVMLLFVTGVSFLIHVYSIGYMGHDANVSRFFSYLNLFVFSMLLLVLADNYLILIIGWGMVGLCSYLLIGFWFDRPSAVLAARKAFVMNVIGDVGMMIAAYLMFVRFGTLSYDGVFSKAQYLKPDTGLMNAICLGLLLGATAKSAQIPLYTWLPDAMEGPTPVSALIHAATMVTAGVYLIARRTSCITWRRSRSPWWPLSARWAPCMPPPSAWCRRTSSGCWPTRPSARSATCSWAAVSAPSAPASSTW